MSNWGDASGATRGAPRTRGGADSTAGEGKPTPPPGPLFGRSLTDALDDAWARVRRQERYGARDGAFTPDEVARLAEDAIAAHRP